MIGIERVCYLFIVYDVDDVKPYISPERGPQKELLAEVKPLFQKRGNLELKEPFQQKYETRVLLSRQVRIANLMNRSNQ